jgi:WhiB family redox-sensing transcriptional regulator
MATSDDWMRRAACRDADTELFFPLPGETERVREAKDHCAVCPVTASCLGWAREIRADFGIYGGFTEDERRRDARNEQRRRQAAEQRERVVA